MLRFCKIALSLIVGASALAAGDYESLVGAIKKSWPACATVAVVCDSANCKAALSSLAGATGGMKLLVVDVKGPQDMGKAISTLTGRKPDVLVLIEGDHVAGDGTSAAGFLIKRMADLKVPTAATTAAGVKQGAALGIGAGTGGKLLCNAHAAAVAGVPVPAGATTI